MDISFHCAGCGQQIVVDATYADATTRCPKCGRSIPVYGVESQPQRSPSDATKRCPYCAEEIFADAIKCKHCGEFLNHPRPPVTSTTYDPYARRRTGGDNAAGGGAVVLSYILAILLPLFGFFAGIYLLVKKQAGHGVACMAISVLMFLIFFALVAG